LTQITSARNSFWANAFGMAHPSGADTDQMSPVRAADPWPHRKAFIVVSWRQVDAVMGAGASSMDANCSITANPGVKQ
jgi:hypothetical protein